MAGMTICPLVATPVGGCLCVCVEVRMCVPRHPPMCYFLVSVQAGREAAARYCEVRTCERNASLAPEVLACLVFDH